MTIDWLCAVCAVRWSVWLCADGIVGRAPSFAGDITHVAHVPFCVRQVAVSRASRIVAASDTTRHDRHGTGQRIAQVAEELADCRVHAD